MTNDLEDTGKPDRSVNTDALPEKNVFQQKEVFQFPQPADWGDALETDNTQRETAGNKEQKKTSKAEGLNEETSEGAAGPFEGFENQQTD